MFEKGSGNASHSIKCVPYKHENLISESQNASRKQGTRTRACKLACNPIEEAETGKSSKTGDLQIHSNSEKESLPKKKVKKK